MSALSMSCTPARRQCVAEFLKIIMFLLAKS